MTGVQTCALPIYYGMIRFEMGYACAVTVVLFIVMVAVNNLIQRIIGKYAAC